MNSVFLYWDRFPGVPFQLITEAGKSNSFESVPQENEYVSVNTSPLIYFPTEEDSRGVVFQINSIRYIPAHNKVTFNVAGRSSFSVKLLEGFRYILTVEEEEIPFVIENNESTADLGFPEIDFINCIFLDLNDNYSRVI